MRTVLTILVAGLLVVGATSYATAQDGARFGMGVELQNTPSFLGLFDTYTSDLSPDLSGGASLTPAILFTIQVTPAVFIEPFVGFHRMAASAEEPLVGKGEISMHDLSFGASLIYALNPDATVSPMLHPLGAVHLLKATEELSGTATPQKNEYSATAFSLGLGVGGMVNLKDGFYFTAEARFLFSSVGDIDVTVEPADGFTDTVDTSASMFDTDMVFGVRFVF